MIAEQIAHIIANVILLLDMDEGDEIDADTGAQFLEWLGAKLEELDRDFLRQLIDAFGAIADQFSVENQQAVRDIPYGYYLEEALAADDPVRLAELDAIRDARD
ncbi:hypothetical protein [Sphingomonas sp. Leaf21]|uniref:hypothetical protein n=1 Tax=Sphingomonas sp. Leaf21 TaxID=2876550 RepID=UPI001E4BA8C9|nr:hypothetical protein [Sphingomonas sp. Leaf21]